MINGNGHNPLRMLLVEDSTDDEALVVRALKKGGYNPVWKRVETEASMQLALGQDSYHVIICDYSLPAFSAERALVIAKEHARDLPFIIISGVVDEEMVVEMLHQGAHDFISKGKMFSRLVFAVRRELRQAGLRMQYRLELEQSYQATIEAWGEALELRDTYTAGHTRRVTDMTLRLADQFNLSVQDLENIHRGSLLHDVGKMGIPDSVLLKPGKLTIDEWAIMSLHPELAYKQLKRIKFLEPALDIPYCHHERWDGSGYPRGLKEYAIPLSARIFSVVDTYDAMTSDRCYRKALSQVEALEFIKRQGGQLFDPIVVEKFLLEFQVRLE